MPTPRPLPSAGTDVAAVVAWARDWLADPTRPPLVVTTSGSTGEPKHVVLSRAALEASATATAQRLGGPGAWFLALPATGVAGLQVVLRALLAGYDPIDVRAAGGWAAALTTSQERPGVGGRRYASLVPTQLRRLLDAAATAESTAEVAALAALDAVLLGGGPVDVALREEAATYGVHTVATYGMSETCGGCVHDGLPLDGVEVAVDDAGRVLVAGPVLFDGYLDDAARTASVLVDGWYRTGDLGRLDAGGRLALLGRADDVVVSGGTNVPGPAVARRLREHPRVVEACVVGVPDAEWGRLVVAVVETADGAPLDLDEARDWVGTEHPRAWAPRRVVTTTVPMLAHGKVDRRAAQRLAEQAGSDVRG